MDVWRVTVKSVDPWITVVLREERVLVAQELAGAAKVSPKVLDSKSRSPLVSVVYVFRIRLGDVDTELVLMNIEKTTEVLASSD